MGKAAQGNSSGNVNRRSGFDRRRTFNTHPAQERAQRLLAKLVSVFIGALVGLGVANFITATFTSDFRRLLTHDQQQREEVQQDLQQASDNWDNVSQEIRWIDDQLGIGAGDVEELPPEPSPLTTAPVAAEPETDETIDTSEADAPPEAEIEEPAEPVALVNSEDEGVARLLERRESLVQQRHNLETERDHYRLQLAFLDSVIPEHERSIRVLDYSSLAVILILTFIGYLFYPLILRIIRRLSSTWAGFTAGPQPRTTQATVGFFAGAILAVIVLLAMFTTFAGEGSFLSQPWFRLLFGAVVVCILGATGALIGVTYYGPPEVEEDPYRDFRRPAPPKLLDSSVIIDGRIAEVTSTGFLAGCLVVTNSVLRELQTMADSSDERRRAKGRRGLELLRKMQDDPRLDVDVLDDSFLDQQAQSTDEQLILAAQSMNGVVVTNDYNLNRVAAIREVRVINVNALANAVKTQHIPGDYFDISILDRGKQRDQGVGYLPDGTMVVVEDGEPYIGETRTIRVTSVTQTVQGRLIFGRVDAAEEGTRHEG